MAECCLITSDVLSFVLHNFEVLPLIIVSMYPHGKGMFGSNPTPRHQIPPQIHERLAVHVSFPADDAPMQKGSSYEKRNPKTFSYEQIPFSASPRS